MCAKLFFIIHSDPRLLCIIKNNFDFCQDIVTKNQNVRKFLD